MADFVAVLKKTIDGMGQTTPEMRARVYDKARSTIAAKLAAIAPPPPAAVAERQKRALEEAITTVEQGYAKPVRPAAPAIDPLAELENIFSSIDRNKNQPSHVRPSAKVEPAAPPPAPQEPAAPVRKAPVPPAAAVTLAASAQAPAADRHPQPSAAERREPRPTPGVEEFPALPASGSETDIFPVPRGARRRGGVAAAVVALLVIAGGAYGVWLNADAFKAMFGGDESEVVKVEPLVPTKPAAAPTAPAAAPAAQQAAAPAAAPADSGETPKFTQRLTPEGKEVDPGPAGGESTVGEGTSVVALTTQPPKPAPSAPVAPETAA